MADNGAPTHSERAQRVSVRLMARPAHFIDVDGHPRGGRALFLLAYLLLERPGGASRDELMELLWDPKPGSDTSGRFRNQLYELSRHLPGGVLERTGRLIGVNPEKVDCDLMALREAIGRDDPVAVLDLYQADVFDETPPRNAQMLEEWADGLRRRTRDTVGEYLARTAGRGLALDPEVYLRVARKLVFTDEESLEGWTHVVRAGVLSGDHPAALAGADQIERLLDETGRSPDSTVRDLLEKARGKGTGEESETLGHPSNFIGRKEQLNQIRRQLWAISQQQPGRSSALTGPSGIGKTRLLDEVAHIARAEGIRVLRARAFETEWRTPNSVLPSVIGPLLTSDLCESLQPGEIAALRPIMPGVQRGRTEDESLRVGFREAVLAVLRAAVRRGPLLVMVDDAHFCDPASLEVLSRIALEAIEKPLLLLLAFRDSHQRMVDPLLASANTLVLRLAPFTREEAGEALDSMARFQGTRVRERLITALLAISGGVPLVFLQHLVLLRREGLLKIENGCWIAQEMWDAGGMGEVAEPVVTLILRRLETLSDGARRVLAAAAVLGHPATIPNLAAVAGLEPAVLPGELETLVRERLLELKDNAAAPAHAEIGEAALRALPPLRIQSMFSIAFRREEIEPGGGSATQLLTLLRFACGAGLGLEGSLLTLEAISSLPRGARRLSDDDEILELLRRIREWCATPGLYARLHKEVTEHGYSSRARRRRIKELNRRIRFRQTVRDPWAQRILAAGVAGAVMIPLLVLAWTRTPTAGTPPLFGGGGVLLLESQGQIRGLRIAGPGPGDTLPVPVSRGMIPSNDSFPEPNGERVLYRCVDFSGPPEICMAAEEREEVIAPYSSDDLPLGWAPDGHAILLISSRGGETGFRYDIFTHDLDQGETRNISNDPLLNYHADWSPDGTRIAYTIRAPGGDSVVVAGVDGSRIEVWGTSGVVSRAVWARDGIHLAFLEVQGGQRTLKVLNTISGTIADQFAVPDGSMNPIWSPDGQFVTVDPGTEGAGLTPALLFPTGENNGPPLALPRGRVRGWLPASSVPFLDRIAVTGPNHLYVGESQRLMVVGEDSRGQPTTPLALFVRSSRPDILQVIGGDTVVAMKAGTARITVSAGGWRTAERTITVTPSEQPRLVLKESWVNGIDPLRWRPYGTPIPSVVTTEDGKSAMRNNGDGSYPSGLVSVGQFSASKGLVVEWTQRTPLTGDYWQEIWIEFLSMSLEEFRTDEGEPFETSATMPLHLAAPIQVDSPPFPLVFGGCGSADTQEIPFDSILTRTAWHRIAVQLFPFGGCDLLVDGRVVGRGRTDGRELWPSRLRLVIGGRTVGTEMLIGEVSVFEGIRYPAFPH